MFVKNRKHRITPIVIGQGLSTKVNANIGTSPDVVHLSHEIRKLKASIKAGADTVMDLSTGGNINRIRKSIIDASSVPVGTVPIYQVAIEAQKKKRPFLEASVDEIFEVIDSGQSIFQGSGDDAFHFLRRR